RHRAAADTVGRLVDRRVDAVPEEPVGAGEAGDAGADHHDPVAGAGRAGGALRAAAGRDEPGRDAHGGTADDLPTGGPALRAVGLGAFAGVLLLAAAIERVLEPLVHLKLLGADPATAATPAEAETLWSIRVARCLGLAAALAMVACGFFGFGVVHAFGDSAAP